MTIPDPILEMINSRLDRIETKVDMALRGHWFILGGLGVIQIMVGAVIMFWSNNG